MTKIQTSVRVGTLLLAGITGAAVSDWVACSKTSIPVFAKAKVSDDSAELSAYIVKMMLIVDADLSDVKKKMVVRSVVNVANDTYSSLEDKKRFVRVIAIESKFDTNAKSSAGAIGLAQIMPQYAHEFSKDCDVSEFRDSDLSYSDVNLVIGACRLKSLIKLYPEGMARVLVAYNAGTASAQMKQLEGLANIANVETSSYVVKYDYLTSLADMPLESLHLKEHKDVGLNRPKSSEKAKTPSTKAGHKDSTSTDVKLK